MKYYVYLIQSEKDKQFYTGFTSDLKKRFKKHQEGKSFSTKSLRPLNLVYYEFCLNEKDAKAIEKYLKTT